MSTNFSNVWEKESRYKNLNGSNFVRDPPTILFFSSFLVPLFLFLNLILIFDWLVRIRIISWSAWKYDPWLNCSHQSDLLHFFLTTRLICFCCECLSSVCYSPLPPYLAHWSLSKFPFCSHSIQISTDHIDSSSRLLLHIFSWLSYLCFPEDLIITEFLI